MSDCGRVGVLYPPGDSCTGSSFYLPTTVYFSSPTLPVSSSLATATSLSLSCRETDRWLMVSPRAPLLSPGVTFPKVTLANPHAPQLPPQSGAASLPAQTESGPPLPRRSLSRDFCADQFNRKLVESFRSSPVEVVNISVRRCEHFGSDGRPFDEE